MKEELKRRKLKIQTLVKVDVTYTVLEWKCVKILVSNMSFINCSTYMYTWQECTSRIILIFLSISWSAYAFFQYFFSQNQFWLVSQDLKKQTTHDMMFFCNSDACREQIHALLFVSVHCNNIRDKSLYIILHRYGDVEGMKEQYKKWTMFGHRRIVGSRRNFSDFIQGDIVGVITFNLA